MQETIKLMPEATGVPEVTPTTPTTDGEKSESQRATDWFKRARGETAQPKDYSGLSGWVRRNAEIRSAKSQLQVEEEYRGELKRLQKARQSAGIPEVLPPAQPTPAVKPPEPSDYADQIARELGGIGAAGTEVKPPPETKQDSTKVEATEVPGLGDGGFVELTINGENSEMLWKRQLGKEGEPIMGEFFLIATKDAKRALSIPEGTRLLISAPNNCAIAITGGKDTKLNIDDLKELRGGMREIHVDFQTADSKNWGKDADIYNEEPGKANFNIFGTSGKEAVDGKISEELSVEQAIALFKKKLNIQPAAGEVPTEAVAPPAKEPVIEAKPDNRDLSQSAFLQWLGELNVDGKGSGRLGVEVMEQLRQIHEKEQELQLRFKLELKGVFEDLSSKAFGSTDKLAKKIGSGAMKLLKTGAIIGGSPFLATAYVAESAIAGAAGVVPAVEHLRSKVEGNIVGRLTAEGKGNMPQAETARQMSEKFQNAADRHRKSIEEWRPFKRFIRALRGSKSKVSLPSPQPERIEEYEEAQAGAVK